MPQRANRLGYYDGAGRMHMVVTSPDGHFVISAYVERGSCSGWHFAYTAGERESLVKVVSNSPDLKRASVYAWHEAVDPDAEGHQPGAYLDLILEGESGWARYPTGKRADGQPVTLLTFDESRTARQAVRLGRRLIFADRPFLPAGRIRAAGVEYIRTGERPTVVAWQDRIGLVPQGAFGAEIAAEADLPPRLEVRTVGPC